MKKGILSVILFFLVVSSLAQGSTVQQQQVLQNASADQVEALKKATPQQLEALRKAAAGAGLDANKKGPKNPVQKTDDGGVRNQDVNTDEVDQVETVEIEEGKVDELLLSIAGREVAVKPVYGREIFRSKNLTFAPSMSMATPPGYVLASGDELNVVLWGAAEGTYSLKLSPEGNINIPNVGLVSLSGITVATAEKRIREKLTSAVSGLADGSVHVKVTLGNIRSIKVNIVGEALNPGTYTLPSLATLFNALYVAGGVSNIGSLRNIKLYRAGKEVAVLDVYDYLLKGKMDIDMRLEDNDMIVVAPYDNIVAISGKVKRPQRYEMKRGEDLATLISYAGDFTGDAYNENISLIRRSGGVQYNLYTIDKKDFDGYQIFDRDVVSVGEILPLFANRVEIQGAVWRPGAYELSDSVKTVKSLLAQAKGLRSDAFVGRAQIIRQRSDMTLEIIPLNLSRILGGQMADVDLRNGDKIVVTSIDDMRQGRFVTIKGEVNNPSTMPFMENMTLQDLIVFSKGLRESASLAKIEIARRIKNPSTLKSSSKQAEMFSFTIPADLSLDDQIASFVLEPYDEVFIRRSPGYSAQKSVYVDGQVVFPGEYTIPSTSTRLTDLVELAGGFTDEAYVNGASLYRRLTSDDMLRIMSIKKIDQSTSDQDVLIKTQNLGVGDYYQVGINLTQALKDPAGKANIALNEGDRLVVPFYTGMVKISGAVYFPTSTSYKEGMSVGQYIEAAGGYADNAKRRPFIIFQNGTISTGAGFRIEPGCEIVVPQRPYREPMSPAAWIGISSSVVSMCAMLISILR